MIRQELLCRDLPDLLLAPDGKWITDATQWECVMRPHWRSLLQSQIYGKLPPTIPFETEVKKVKISFAGKASYEEVTFHFTNGEKRHSVTASLIAPLSDKPLPFFIHLNFRPDIPDRYQPTEEILDNGFGIFSVCHKEVTTDDGDFTNGLAGLFASEGERASDEAGKLCYWAWMAMRMMDYLHTRPEADKERIGVAGHSRLGKTALLCAALDERFAFACANDSGCSGAAISRGCCEGGEDVAAICRVFPHWFCPNYLQYANNVEALPLDQHALIALIAPRRVMVGGAELDVWADNTSQFLSLAAASPVWELYGKAGLITPPTLPSVGERRTDGELGFHLRPGKHFFSRSDWLVYMDVLQSAHSKT